MRFHQIVISIDCLLTVVTLRTESVQSGEALSQYHCSTTLKVFLVEEVKSRSVIFHDVVISKKSDTYLW